MGGYRVKIEIGPFAGHRSKQKGVNLTADVMPAMYVPCGHFLPPPSTWHGFSLFPTQRHAS